MSLACSSDNSAPQSDHEFKLAPSADLIHVLSTLESRGILLSQQLFTQDESRLRNHSKTIAKNPELCQVYVDIVLASRHVHKDLDHDRIARIAASNAISVLNYGSRSGIFPFRFIDVRDWSGIRVPDANLNYAVMAHCSLDDADFSGASMINIILFGAQLRRANLSRIKSHEMAIFQVENRECLVVHPHGYFAASRAPEGAIRIFNLETGADERHLYGHNTEITALTFNRDGGYLGSMSREGLIRIWNMSTYECTSILQPLPSWGRFIPYGIRLNPDNSHVMAILPDGTLSVANVNTCEWIAAFNHEHPYNAEWSPVNNRIFSCTYSGDMHIWDVETKSCVLQWRMKVVGYCGAKLTLDGTKIIVVDRCEIYLLDATTGDCLAQLSTEVSDGSSINLDSWHLYLVDGQWIHVYNLETLTHRGRYFNSSCTRDMFSTSNGQKLIVCCKHDEIVKVFDITSLESCIPTIGKAGLEYGAFAFSPDNRFVVGDCYDEDGNIKVFDLTSGHCTEIAPTGGYYSSIHTLSYSPIGQFVAYAGIESNVIFIYDVHERKCRIRLDKHETFVICVTFNSRGNLLASSAECDESDNDGSILLWDTRSWTCRALRGHRHDVEQLCFSPDGNILVSVSRYEKIRMWNVITDECIMRIGDGSVHFTCPISYSPCGRFLAAVEGREGRQVRIWSTTNGQCVNTLPETPNEPLADGVYFLRNGRLISVNATYRMYDIFTGEYVDLPFEVTHTRLHVSLDRSLMVMAASSIVGSSAYLLQFPEEPWKAEIVSTADSDIAATSTALQVLTAWPKGDEVVIAFASNQDESIEIRRSSQPKGPTRLQGHLGLVTCISPSFDGQYLVSGSRDSTIRLWDAGSNQCIAILEGHTDTISCLSFSSDGRFIASGSHDATIRIWSTSECKCISHFEGHTTSIKQIMFSPDNGTLASVGLGSNTICIWDLAIGSCSMELDQHTDQVFDIQFSSDGNYLVSGSHDDTIRVWQARTGECIATLKGHTDSLTCFALTADAKTLVSGSEDTTIRIWNVPEGRCSLVIKGHTGHVRSLCITPDNRCIISASNDHVIHIWDINTGKLLHQLLGHSAAITSVKLIRYDAQGDSLVISTSEDGVTRLWTVNNMPVRVAYLPEVCGALGPQEAMDLCSADLTDAIMEETFAQITKHYGAKLG